MSLGPVGYPMGEPREVRLRRLSMRSMRRGIKEMDLILGGFAVRSLDAMHDMDLDVYDRLLAENDHDIYGWILGRTSPPPTYHDLVLRIAADAGSTSRPDNGPFDRS